MSRKIDYLETECFAQSLMADVCSTFEKSFLEKIDAVVEWEGFREVLESIWPYAVDTEGLIVRLGMGC